MRPQLVTIMAMCIVIADGCGAVGPSGHSTHVRRDPTASGRLRSVKAAIQNRLAKDDVDSDGDNGNDDERWGQAAKPSDRHAIIALVRRYYADAAAGDGAAACTLIYSILAEEIPEVYGEPPGPPALRGTTCGRVTAKLFRQNRTRLLEDLTALRVVRVRVKRLRGLALLRFGRGAERDIPVHREHNIWRIDAMLDGGLG